MGCDHDDALHTLTIDFGHYVWRHVKKGRGIPVIEPEVEGNDGATDLTERGYWWLNAAPGIWSWSDVNVGEEATYTLYNDEGHKRRIFQNFLDAQPGDPIVGYATSPIRQIVAFGCATKKQDGTYLYFEKTEDLVTPVALSDIQANPVLEGCEYLQKQQGSPFRLTANEYAAILDMAGHGEDTALLEQDDDEEKPESIAPYTKKDFLSEVYMSEERYERLRGVLLNKLNLILHNAEIRHDPTLGKGFEIGHSHLCGRKSCDDEWLREVVDYDIIPTLEEYWFDSDEKVSRWKAVLRGVFEQ